MFTPSSIAKDHFYSLNVLITNTEPSLACNMRISLGFGIEPATSGLEASTATTLPPNNLQMEQILSLAFRFHFERIVLEKGSIWPPYWRRCDDLSDACDVIARHAWRHCSSGQKYGSCQKRWRPLFSRLPPNWIIRHCPSKFERWKTTAKFLLVDAWPGNKVNEKAVVDLWIVLYNYTDSFFLTEKYLVSP